MCGEPTPSTTVLTPKRTRPEPRADAPTPLHPPNTPDTPHTLHLCNALKVRRPDATQDGHASPRRGRPIHRVGCRSPTAWTTLQRCRRRGRRSTVRGRAHVTPARDARHHAHGEKGTQHSKPCQREAADQSGVSRVGRLSACGKSVLQIQHTNRLLQPLSTSLATVGSVQSLPRAGPANSPRRPT